MMHVDLAAFESSADQIKYAFVSACTIRVDDEDRLLPIFIPIPRKDAATVLKAVQDAMSLMGSRQLVQIPGSRIVRIQGDGGGEFNNEKLKSYCQEIGVQLTFSPAHQPSSNGIAERMVGLCKTAVRRLLKQAQLEAAWWSYACRMSARMMREKVVGRIWKYPLFGQLVGIWRGHDKASIKRGAIGKLLDIDIWESQTTRILVGDAVVKGLSPQQLDPSRYQLSHGHDMDADREAMPWRAFKDAVGKYKWLDYRGVEYLGTPYAIDAVDIQYLRAEASRQEIVYVDEEAPETSVTSKVPEVTIQAKSVPVSPKDVASSAGDKRQKWLESIYREMENFTRNMAIIDASPEIIAEFRSRGKWPLPCQMVFVLKPLTTSQIAESGQVIPYKCKSRLVMCGNFAAWSEQSTSSTSPVHFSMLTSRPAMLCW